MAFVSREVPQNQHVSQIARKKQEPPTQYFISNGPACQTLSLLSLRFPIY